MKKFLILTFAFASLAVQAQYVQFKAYYYGKYDQRMAGRDNEINALVSLNLDDRILRINLPETREYMIISCDTFYRSQRTGAYITYYKVVDNNTRRLSEMVYSMDPDTFHFTIMLTPSGLDSTEFFALLRQPKKNEPFEYRPNSGGH